jgi:hypothetical protein
LYKWRVKLKNSFPEPLATQLVLYASQFDIYDIVLEILFESTYPMVPPKIRIVEPRFLPGSLNALGPGGVIDSPLFQDGGDWTPVHTVHNCVKEIISKITSSCHGKNESFEFLDPNTRAPYSSSEANSQRNGFIQFYRIMSIDDMDSEMGGKIELPPSALEHISRALAPEFPLIFELKQTKPSASHRSSNNFGNSMTGDEVTLGMENVSILADSTSRVLRKTYAGVTTFEAVEGFALVPSWIVKNLGAQDGEVISVRMVSLPKGDLVKLQPHDPTTFLAMEQPKEILESVLRSYVALQTDDVLHLSFDHVLHSFSIVNTLPAHAIDIRDTDLKLEIQIPDDFKHDEDSKITSEDPSNRPKSPSVAHSLASSASVSIPSSTVPSTTCSNCKKHVPNTSIATHEAFCKRNNLICEQCGQLIRIADQAAHFEEAHKPVKCVCGESIEMRLLAQHKQNDCMHRPMPCTYCKLRKKMLELPAHEEYCGSRTEKCAKCQRFVSMKDHAQHVQTNCKYPPVPEEPSIFAKLKGFFTSATDGP